MPSARPGSPARLAAKLVEHVPDMVRYRAHGAPGGRGPLPVAGRPGGRPLAAARRPTRPDRSRPPAARAPARPGAGPAAPVRRRRCGRRALGVRPRSAGRTARRRPGEGPGDPPRRVQAPDGSGARGAAARPSWPPCASPVVLFFGLLRPYKGLETLLEAWRGVDGAELWIVGRPRMPLEPLRAAGAGGRPVHPAVRLRRRAAGVLPPGRRRGAPLLADRAAGLVGRAGHRAGVRQADRGERRGRVRRGGRGRRRSAGGARRCRCVAGGAGSTSWSDPQEREGLAWGALTAAKGAYSWEAAARETLALYRDLVA